MLAQWAVVGGRGTGERAVDRPQKKKIENKTTTTNVIVVVVAVAAVVGAHCMHN